MRGSNRTCGSPGSTEKFETLGTYISRALDELLSSHYQSFSSQPNLAAVQAKEKYFLGQGARNLVSLFEGFYNPNNTRLYPHLPQAIFHELLEAVTPAGADEQAALAIHRAIIDQIQAAFFDTGRHAAGFAGLY